MFLVTSNPNKVKEFSQILRLELAQVNLDLDEIQAIEVEKVVRHKAKQAYDLIKRPLLVEDTGLYIEEWHNFPGALIKWVGETIGYERICQMIGKNRRAKAETAVGFYDGRTYQCFTGKVIGKIANQPMGKTNFGWDNVFIPDGYCQTFAQMGLEKNKISMRRIALERLQDFLKSYH